MPPRPPDPSASGGTHLFLEALGVVDLPPRTSAFDPGYDAATVIAHLEQSGRLLSRLKLSMATWLLADEKATQRKIDAAHRLGVPLVTGGGPFEIAQARGCLDDFMALCARLGIDRIEAGEGFTPPGVPEAIMQRAERYGLEVQVELGEKHAGVFDRSVLDQLTERGRRWLAAGAKQIVVEGRESAQGIGLFDESGKLNVSFAEHFLTAWGPERTVFEAPTKRSQFDFLTHFGPLVNLSNVRLEEILRVEIYRRGLHADSYNRELAPRSRPKAEIPQ
jgi:phosphosulfolactate synthase